MLADNLSAHHFRVSAAATGDDASKIVRKSGVDLAVVDLNLGREDGLHIVRQLSALAIPVIIITGNRTDEADKVVGLETGAVDYLTKPFGMRELLARIRSRLRQRNETKSVAVPSAYAFGEYRVNTRGRKLFRNEAEVKLSAAEFNLLVAFLRTPNQVMTREQLLNESRVRGDGVFDRSIDVLILRLRRKLERHAARPSLIKTIRNAGYVFDADVTKRAESAS